MRTERIITLALVIGISGASLSSCGDEAEALSKPEFVEQADAICQAADDEITLIFDAAFEGFEDLDWDDPANEGLIFDKFAEAADGDEAAMRAIDEETEDPLDDVNRRAREYGFTVCGEEG